VASSSGRSRRKGTGRIIAVIVLVCLMSAGVAAYWSQKPLRRARAIEETNQSLQDELGRLQLENNRREKLKALQRTPEGRRTILRQKGFVGPGEYRLRGPDIGTSP